MEIPYYPNALDLTSYMQGNCQNPRTRAIAKVTPHHCAGIVDGKSAVLGIINTWINRQASANYVIDRSGNAYLIVPHSARAWTSGNRDNDMQAITLELSNDSNKYPWTISDKTINTTVDLTAWICAKYGITPLYNGTKSGTITTHRMFQATQCPGDYFVAQWLDNGLFVSSVKQIIPKWQGGETLEPVKDEPITCYVQIGAYKRKQSAINQSLTLDGYSVITDKDGLHKVRKPCTASNVDVELAKAREMYPRAFKGAYNV